MKVIESLGEVLDKLGGCWVGWLWGCGVLVLIPRIGKIWKKHPKPFPHVKYGNICVWFFNISG